MKHRRTFVRAAVLVAVVVVPLLLLVSIYTVMASQAPPARLAPDFPAAPSSADEWSSGWVTIPIPAGAPPRVCQIFDHNLGHSPEEYAVELWFRDLDDGWGRNRRYYGGLEDNGKWYGAWWQELTTNTIRVCRGRDDDAADEVLIRVFEPLAEPDRDSDWMDIGRAEVITFTHGVGITATDLTVGLWFSSTNLGIHHFSYGGLAVDPNPPTHTGLLLGAHWQNLTTNTVHVFRHPHDTDIQQVRVIVVHGAPPRYDSLEDRGWQPIAPGTAFTFSHDLDWNPDMLLVRGECYDPTGPWGIHQLLSGGNHDWLFGWQGASLQKLTRDTVAVARLADDQVCPQVHIRIWKRGRQIYLPLVVRSY
jgi:hypothetical protein